jgi:ferredoxin
MGKIKVTVNHNRCVGSQLCVNYQPEVFELNDEGQSVIISIEGVDPISLVQTAEQCPQCAIKVEDAETGEVLFPPAELGM